MFAASGGTADNPTSWEPTLNDDTRPADGGDTIRYGRRAPVFTPVPEWVIVAGLSPQALALYVALLAHVNHARGDGTAWPGMDALCALLGYRHRNSVGRYVRELVVAGAVEVRRRERTTLRRNEYVVHELPLAEHTGARTLGEFYAAYRADRPMPTVVCIGTHTESSVATHTEVCQNKMKRTRRTEPDEVTAGAAHDSVEDAYAAVAHEQARGRDRRKPMRIFTPKGFYEWAEDADAVRYLVGAAVKAMTEAGLEPAVNAADRIGHTLRHEYAGASRRDLVRATEWWVNLAGTEDPGCGWLASSA